MIMQFDYLIKDLKRWKCVSIKDMFYTFFEQGVWAVILYRFSRMLYLINIPVIKLILRFIAFLVLKFSEVFLGISLKAGCDIGPGLYIGHSGAIVVHPNVVVGKNLSIGTGVVIGERGVGKGGCPIMGNNVYVGVGAKILGNVKIGNNVNIGANAVVIKDVGDNQTAVGVPAKIIDKGNNK